MKPIPEEIVNRCEFAGRSLLWASLLFVICMIISCWDEVFRKTPVNISGTMADNTRSLPQRQDHSVTIVYTSQKRQANS